MASFPFPNRISQASNRTSDQKFLVAAYGDGYEQRAAIGINSLFDVWDIELNALDLTDRNTFQAFWKAHGRVQSFDWTPPNGVAGKYIFNNSIQESNIGMVYGFRFQLREVFEA